MFDKRATEGMVKFLESRWFVPLTISAGLLLRVAVALLWPVDFHSDAAWYARRAQDLVNGLGYQEGGNPTAYWPVGWPAILAAMLYVTGSLQNAVLIANLFGAILIMGGMYYLSRLLFKDEPAARIAVLAYAFYPNHVLYAGQAMTETLYTGLVMVAFSVMAARLVEADRRWWYVPFAGLLYGVATLIKPQTMLFPLGVFIAMLLFGLRQVPWKVFLRAFVVVHVAMALIVAPWSLRNQRVFGEFIMVSTNGGTALFLGANDLVTGRHFEFQHTEVFERIGIPWEERVERQVELDKALKRAAVEWIRNNPAAYIAWMPRKIAYLWERDTSGFWAFELSYPGSGLVKVLKWFNQVLYLLILVGAVLAAAIAGWRWMKDRDGRAGRVLFVFCMPVFVSLLAAVFTGQHRYHFAAMPFLIVAASWVIAGQRREGTG